MKKPLLAILCLLCAACEDPGPAGPVKPDPEPATLLTARLDAPVESLAVDEIVRLEPELVFSGEADSGKLKFAWSVTQGGVPVALENAAQGILNWIPDRPGAYSAHVTIEYGPKTVEIYVVVLIKSAGGDAKRLEEIRKGVLGTWKGTVTTPWISPYEVEMVLRDDGTYSARTTVQPPEFDIPALYYGTDADSPLKTWFLDDVKSNGEASGALQVFFDPNTTQDEIRRLRVGGDGDSLAFEMWHLGQYGPVRFELARAP